MAEAKLPPDEASRLAALSSCRILDTAPEEAFDDITRVASEVCGAPFAFVSLVDEHRQWFKARVGFDSPETPRRVSFCAHALEGNDGLIVPDTLQDPRFVDNPLVTGAPSFRFYAGVPLQVDAGSAVGTLCVLDRVPRVLTPSQLDALRALARQISRELRLRRSKERASADRVPDGVPLEAGSIVGGRYSIVRPIGKGGIGAVFEARDEGGARVAIKVMLPGWRANPEVLERFAREARVLMRLRSPHVARLLDVGNLSPALRDLPFLVLEYLEGTDLDALIARRGKVPWRDAFTWCADACDGVTEAHDLGVIHRDLKPSNLFLAKEAAGPVVKVLDFGIAKAEGGTEKPLTVQGGVIGSAAYMSPEQMLSSREVDARSDVWSMGATIYELVSGKLPFAGGSELEMYASVLIKPPLPMRAHAQDVPPEVEELIRKCLAKPREDRFPTMHALASALRASVAAA